MTFENIVLVAGGLLSGLLAGVYYTFHIAIVPALRSLKAVQHISAMQAINIKIKNPLFLLSFLAPSILLPLAAFLHRGGSQFLLLAAASLFYIVGSNGITMFGNIPLNDQLEKVDVNRLSETEAEQIRNEFQGAGAKWMQLHTVRTLMTTVATILVFIVCLSKNVSD